MISDNLERPGPSNAKSSPRCQLSNVSLMQTVISSSTGAICTSLLMTPMDVVKIRIQQQAKPITKGECFLYNNGLMEHFCTACAEPKKNLPCEWYQRPSHFTGTFDAFIKIARNEGVRSLWSGLSPTLVMAVPSTVFYFSVYDFLHSHLKEYCVKRAEWVAPMVAGAFARTIAGTVVSPLEMIRTKMQSEMMSYKDVGSAIRTSVLTYGWRGFYLGWAPTLWRDVPFSAIYWACVETFRKRLIVWRGRTETNFGISATAAAASGIVAALCTAPFDVVKTQRQVSLGKVITTGTKPRSTSTMSVMQDLVSNRGFTALWAGSVPRIAKIAPACAIMLGSYDFWKLYFAHRNSLKD
ncbi:unnamed protein product, partial [Mesorhabditis belari]|uniref:Mitochondrial carrier protein n=1 Tax=Mesorhabditis belari TaxID=2138241 RepID=A0AAF3EBD0_9BILA